MVMRYLQSGIAGKHMNIVSANCHSLGLHSLCHDFLDLMAHYTEAK